LPEPSKIATVTVLGVCSPSSGRNSEQSHSEASTAQPEDLGWDFYNARTNKIGRIHSVTPTHVWVIYEDGKCGRNIPRMELESPLKERYPYDPAKAADFTAALQARQAQQRTAANTSLLRQENALQSKIDGKNAELTALQKEITAWRHKPRQPGKRVALNGLLDKKIGLQKEISSLAKQLEGARSLQAQYR
jgi:hypothetical protein